MVDFRHPHRERQRAGLLARQRRVLSLSERAVRPGSGSLTLAVRICVVDPCPAGSI